MQLRNLSKYFKTAKGVYKAVDAVDLDIQPSSITALLGPSGSGKTTLLRLIAGLEKPTSGRVLFDEDDATEVSVQDRQIGFVFQSYALFNHKTVSENIKFGLQVCLSILQPAVWHTCGIKCIRQRTLFWRRRSVCDQNTRISVSRPS